MSNLSNMYESILYENTDKEELQRSINNTQRIMKDINTGMYSKEQLMRLFKKTTNAEVKAFYENEDFINLFDDAVGEWELDSKQISEDNTYSSGKENVIFITENKALEEKWNIIINKISKIRGCEKIIKTKVNSEDIILFICNSITTKFICYVNDEYLKIMDEVDFFFDLRVINENEFKNLNYEKYKVCWENKNA